MIGIRTMPPDIRCKNCKYFYMYVKNEEWRFFWVPEQRTESRGKMIVCQHPENFKSSTLEHWGCIHYEKKEKTQHDKE